jgi:hypothetical protein
VNDCVTTGQIASLVIEGVGNGLFSLAVLFLCLSFLDKRFGAKG